MPITSLIAALAFTSAAPAPRIEFSLAQDTVKLERSYKDKETNTYLLDTSGGPLPKMHLNITEKVVKILDGGSATVELTGEDPDHASEGSGPDKETVDFNKLGMPAVLHVDNNKAPYAFFGVTCFLPGASLAPGKDFPISWTSAENKDFTINGTGTFVGLEDKDGKKLAKVKTKLDVHPGADGEATAQNVSYFDPASGKLVSASGTVTINGEDVTYTIKLTKEA